MDSGTTAAYHGEFSVSNGPAQLSWGHYNERNQRPAYSGGFNVDLSILKERRLRVNILPFDSWITSYIGAGDLVAKVKTKLTINRLIQ